VARLAVVGTFYHRQDDIPALSAAIRAQTRAPDEIWWMHEVPADGDALRAADWGPSALHVVNVAIPRGDDGAPLVTPFAPLINRALDSTTADLIVYLTDDSLPEPDKYHAMAEALEEHPDRGAVFCWQSNRAGGRVHTINAGGGRDPVRYGWLDHTQVMHRATALRWPEDITALHDADWWYFRALAVGLGPIYAVPRVLDTSDRRTDGLNVRVIGEGSATFGAA
jgi:GT2 family glycosyltransferase